MSGWRSDTKVTLHDFPVWLAAGEADDDNEQQISHGGPDERMDLQGAEGTELSIHLSLIHI